MNAVVVTAALFSSSASYLGFWAMILAFVVCVLLAITIACCLVVNIDSHGMSRNQKADSWCDACMTAFRYVLVIGVTGALVMIVSNLVAW